MNYAYEIRRQAEAAPRAALPAVASALWKAFSEGQVSEAEAEALSGLIEARQRTDRPTDLHQRPISAPRSRTGSRPRTDASMARRRRWAASGRLPPGLAARFTLAEQAVLAVIAVEVTKRGRCALAIGAVAALAGVSETSVWRALREARTLGLITIDERRLSRFRNDTNLITIIDRAWTAWLRLARQVTGSGSGSQTRQGTNTPVSYPVNSEGRRPKKGCRQAASDPSDRASLRIQVSGGASRAMR